MSHYIQDQDRAILGSLNLIMRNKDFEQFRAYQKEHKISLCADTITHLLNEVETLKFNVESLKTQLQDTIQHKLL